MAKVLEGVQRLKGAQPMYQVGDKVRGESASHAQ